MYYYHPFFWLDGGRLQESLLEEVGRGNDTAIVDASASANASANANANANANVNANAKGRR